MFVKESQIYQVGIREMLCILSLHFGGWSEKTDIQADPFYPQLHRNTTATFLTKERIYYYIIDL